MSIRYNYTLSGDFSSGISIKNLTNEINTDLPGKSFFVTIITTADTVRITFTASLSSPEVSTLNTVVLNHDPNEIESETLPRIETSDIAGSTGTVQIEGTNFTGNQVIPAGATGVLSNWTFDADQNTLTNIDDSNVKSNAGINSNKLADGSVSNTEFQYINSLTSNVQDQIDQRVIGPGSSIDQGLIRFNGTSGDNVEAVGVRHYGALSSNPSSPTPQAGDQYYNTTINQEMRYDGTRSKWLSVATLIDGAGRNGTTGANQFYRRWNGMALASNLGPFIGKGTIIYIGYSTSTAVTHTYEVLVDGVVIASLASGGSASARSNTVNADFDEGILSSRNASGSNTTNQFQSVIYYKLRP